MVCANCQKDVNGVVIHKVGGEFQGLWCRPCHYGDQSSKQTIMIATDDIPGGLEVKHGICNEDGTPKKYYSKSEIKRAAYEKGLFIIGDTPKPNPRLEEEKARKRNG